MHIFLKEFIDLIYENSCLICSSPCKRFSVCNICEDSFIQRKTNYIKHFKEITVYSYGLYEGTLREGILALKAGKKKLSDYFSKKLADFLNCIPEKIINQNQLIIPVPSHKKRIKERGYCQSTLIAKYLANSLSIKYSNELAVRNKETKYMNSLSNINERIENVKNAFCITHSEPIEKNILIVDDILTSGSTICELARTIHKRYPELNLAGLTVASGDTYV